MSRKFKKNKNALMPDIKFNSILVAKLINHIMQSGKKSIAEKIVYKSLNQLQQLEESVDSLIILETALGNIAPILEIKTKKIGGSIYQVPIEINLRRRLTLAFRWLIISARQRQGKTMSSKLAYELFDAFRYLGLAIKKKKEIHRIAESNRAFSHFRW